jgi:hypothetical protein
MRAPKQKLFSATPSSLLDNLSKVLTASQRIPLNSRNSEQVVQFRLTLLNYQFYKINHS